MLIQEIMTGEPFLMPIQLSLTDFQSKAGTEVIEAYRAAKTNVNHS